MIITHRRHAILLILSLLCLLGACQDEEAADRDVTARADADATASADATDVNAVEVPAICEAVGLSPAAMQAAEGTAFGQVAGDFSVETRAGTFRLEETWTGCESYLFHNYYPGISSLDALWASGVGAMVEAGPRNVHYFFGTYTTPEWDIAAAQGTLDAMQSRIDAYLMGLSPGDAEHWRARIHLITTPVQEAGGALGAFFQSQMFIRPTIAIGVDQRWDPVGSLSEVQAGGFVESLRMSGYLGHYFNFRAGLRARLAAESDVTILPIMTDEEVTDRILDREIALPDAATMAAFDTLEFDLTVTCPHEISDCSEWDRIAYITLCENADCSENLELVRWITPYWRPGSRRWVMDASPMLGLLREGGPRTLRVVMGPDWERATSREVRLEARLSARGGPRSVEVLPTFRGGDFNDTYNADREPFLFTPPADASRVELVTIISGHGQAAATNCAEWCDHQHTFTINDDSRNPIFIGHEGQAGQPYGCAELAGQGVIPGQGGNWAPLRAAWCPGLPVAANRADITAQVNLGAENTLTYRGTFERVEPPAGDNGNVVLTTYVVIYRD